MKTKDRPLPRNEHAERTILGAILLDNKYFAQCDWLSPGDFSLDSHRLIFTSMSQMLRGGLPVDYVTLLDWMDGAKYLSRIGESPRAYIASLTEGIPMNPAIKDYIRIVKEKAALRTIITACDLAIDRAYDADPSKEIIAELKALSEV